MPRWFQGGPFLSRNLAAPHASKPQPNHKVISSMCVPRYCRQLPVAEHLNYESLGFIRGEGVLAGGPLLTLQAVRRVGGKGPLFAPPPSDVIAAIAPCLKQ